MSNSDLHIQSVDRAVTLMEILARRGWCGVTELADELDIHKSTAYRLLATLRDRGLVQQHGETSKYRLGARTLQLASAVAPDLDLRDHLRHACEALAEATGETANAAVLDGDRVIHVEQVAGSGAVMQPNWLWRRTPLHCTSVGKVFLAHLDDDQRADLLAGPLERLTPDTIVDASALEAELERVRRRGYAVTAEELEAGLNAVASPIRSRDGQVVAALTVSGPSSRLPRGELVALGELTRDSADDASNRLRLSVAG